jgi:hypothetical protein
MNHPAPDRTYWNAWAYGFLVLAGLSYLFIPDDRINAVIFLSIALAFDPFDQRQTWQQRPRWQQLWLIGHLAFSIGTFLWVVSGR